MKTWGEVENYFSYHKPEGGKIQVHERINTQFLDVASFLWNNIEPRGEGSADKTYIFRALSDARMAANMAVACGPIELYM